MEDDQNPLMINDDGDYSVFVSESNRKMSSDATQLVLRSSLVKESGFWMYSNYSSSRVKMYRFLHLCGVFSESLLFIVCESLAKFKKGYFKNTPFCVDPIFNSVLWGIVILLGCFFLTIIYKPTPLSISLLSDSLRRLYFCVYAFICCFFILTNLVQGIVSDIFTDLCAIGIFSIMIYSYLRIKYEDDGRYIVNWCDYLGINVHFSVLLAWSLMMICEYFFVALAEIFDSNTKDATLLGVEHQTWTVTMLVLNFMVATFWLQKYKDVYFAVVLAYSFFGIFSLQVRETCQYHQENCSNMVKAASLSLALILLVFATLTFVFYPKLVLYNFRKN